MRGRLADHGRTDRADVPAGVPGRVPARAELSHAGRPDGRQLPAPVRLLDHLAPAEIERAQQVLGNTESTGQDRMCALHAPYRRSGVASDLEIYPNLWAGVGLVRSGAGTAVVGSHAQVADLIEEYAALGICEFILSGYPHLEEAYRERLGSGPVTRRSGTCSLTGPAGAGVSPDTVDREHTGRHGRQRMQPARRSEGACCAQRFRDAGVGRSRSASSARSYRPGTSSAPSASCARRARSIRQRLVRGGAPNPGAQPRGTYSEIVRLEADSTAHRVSTTVRKAYIAAERDKRWQKIKGVAKA